MSTYPNTKFTRKYGTSAREMADKLDISFSSLMRYLKNKKKKAAILKMLKIKEKKDIFC